MGKFAIECPHCNHYVTAYNGLRGLIQNKVICNNCQNEIDVQTQRMTSVTCSECNNVVVYDQGKKIPRCPVCGNKIAPEPGQKMTSFSCPTCGVGLSASEGTAHYTCPICATDIDVKREIAKDRYSKQGMASIIKYEGDNNTFVWKHPIEDFNLGSQLIVHESQEAVFFRDGQALDLFGAGRHILETQNLPMMNTTYQLSTGNTKATFHSEIYYINMVTQMGLKWGTDQKVRLFEPKTGMHVSVSAYGEFNIRVIDSRKILLKLVGTTNGLKSATESNNQSEGRGYGSDIPTMNSKFRGLIITKVKNNLANVIKKENISLFEIDSHLEDISRVLQDCINEGLKDYGLMMPEFYVMNIATPEDDDPQDEFGNPNQEREAWMLAKSLHAQQYIDVQKQRVAQATAEAERERLRVEVETDAQMRILEAKGEAEALKIQKAAEAEAYRMKAEAEAAEMQMKGYSFRDQMARDVSMEAMKNGLTGTGSSAGSIVGDVAGLGVALGAMNGVMGVTRDTIQPMLDNSMTQNHANRHTTPETWDCPECGAKGLVGKFCPECGEKRPEVSATWDCPGCGAKGLVGKFCPECGAKRPDESKTWDCPECGAKGLVGKFCPECGAKRPEASATWDCPECGAKELSTKFCPKCGAKRPTEVESATWDCPGCGAKGLSSQNCPECGRNREEV